jgi:hypothetical protein
MRVYESDPLFIASFPSPFFLLSPLADYEYPVHTPKNVRAALTY